jgi:superfamily II DNA or RNA helicase
MAWDLSEVYQEIIYSKPLPDMIKDGYLSPVAGYRVETDVDLTRVKTRMGDFVTSQLSSAVNVEERKRIITKVYNDYLREKRPSVSVLMLPTHLVLQRPSGVKV